VRDKSSIYKDNVNGMTDKGLSASTEHEQNIASSMVRNSIKYSSNSSHHDLTRW
jgi:hypothetical protein